MQREDLFLGGWGRGVEIERERERGGEGADLEVAKRLPWPVSKNTRSGCHIL